MNIINLYFILEKCGLLESFILFLEKKKGTIH